MGERMWRNVGESNESPSLSLRRRVKSRPSVAPPSQKDGLGALASSCGRHALQQGRDERVRFAVAAFDCRSNGPPEEAGLETQMEDGLFAANHRGSMRDHLAHTWS